MRARKKRHPLYRAFIWFGLLVGALGLAVFIVFGNPRPFFAYSKTAGQITFYATTPIPESFAADIAKIETRLRKVLPDNPFPEVSMYVTGPGWRTTLFFVGSPRASGVVYFPLTRDHGFLRGADFAHNRLVRDDRPAPPPFTLRQYATHELTHVLLGQRLGVLRFHRLPHWVAEGLPDYVALGGLDAQTYARYGQGRRLGYYAPFRRLVTAFLEEKNWTIDQLLATDLTFEQAMAQLG